jgi:hypothetical protein
MLSGKLGKDEGCMNGDDHLAGLGKVTGNFHALEHVLRVFLCEAKGEQLEYPSSTASSVVETHLTNRDSLKPITDEYNDALGPTEQQHRVDPTVVDIRDALAHGRIASAIESFPVTLFKFGKKDATSKILVERVDVLDETWFENKRALVRKQIDAVVACSKGRSYKLIKS